MSLGTRLDGSAEEQLAVRQAAMRMAVAASGSFVVGEANGWNPSFIGPVLVVVLMSNMPQRPSLKVMLGLTLVMAVAAWSAYVLAALLLGVPIVMYGALSLGVFLCFYGLTTGKPGLPLTLTLICLVLIPVVMTVAPGQASLLPKALVEGIAVALVTIWIVHQFWPLVPAPAPKPPPPAHPAPPLLLAVLATAVVLPLMLVFLLFGYAGALPVLVGTLLLVLNFDVQRGFRHGVTLILGNFGGGMFGMLMFVLLTTTPTLPFLGLLVFLAILWFARAVVNNPQRQAVAVIACKAMLIIFGSSIAAGSGSVSLWLERALYFSLAGAIALTAMTLLWNFAMPRWAPESLQDRPA